MRTLFLSIIIALMAINICLYAQEKDTTQAEIKLELIWEKEFPEGIVDVAFDKERKGLFCPSIIITGKGTRSCTDICFMDNTGQITYHRELGITVNESFLAAKSKHSFEPVKKRLGEKLKGGAYARISENGEYIGILEPTKWDGEGIGSGLVEIIDLLGNVVSRVPDVYGDVFWVSPKGDGILSWNPWSETSSLIYTNEITEKIDLSQSNGREKIEIGQLNVLCWLNTAKQERQIVKLWDKKLKYASIAPLKERGLSFTEAAPLLVSPDRNWITAVQLLRAGSKFSWFLNVYNQTGRNKLHYPLSNAGCVYLSFSPNSEYLVVSIARESRLLVVEFPLLKIVFDKKLENYRGFLVDISNDGKIVLTDPKGWTKIYYLSSSDNPRAEILPDISDKSSVLRNIADIAIGPTGDEVCLVTFSGSIKTYKITNWREK